MSNRKYYPVRVKEVVPLTAEAKGIVLDIPKELKETFAFTQGQYINLRKELDGEEVVRSYSLYTSPLQDKWAVGVKLVEGGKFSTFANQQLEAGDILDVMPPDGKFFVELDAQQGRNYVAFAAGSGITPVLSIIRTTLETEPNSRFHLFYGNKKTESIIFKEELENLKDQFIDRFSLFHVLSKEEQDAEMFNGRIDVEKCKIYGMCFFDFEEVDHFFLCGPSTMIMSLKEYLESEKNINPSKVHYELFNTIGIGEETENEVGSSDSSDEVSKVTIILDGNSTVVEVHKEGESIVDAGNEQGMELPYSCKAGVCCTCRAKVLKGSVRMDVNYALEEDEVDDGFILCCQAHPTSNELVVSFDE